MKSRIICVWGPAGSPGRTTTAINLAAEIANQGKQVILLDADTYASSIGYYLGISDEASGIAALCRLAEMEALDSSRLSEHSFEFPRNTGGLKVVTGINRPNRWPELGMDNVDKVITFLASESDVVVIDVGAILEMDEEISSDLFAPRRNAAAIASMRASDVIVEVTGSDPLSLSRFIRAHLAIKQNYPDAILHTVVNKLERSSTFHTYEHGVFESLTRFAGIHNIQSLRNDPQSVQKAVSAQKPVSDVAGHAGIVSDFSSLAAHVVSSERAVSHMA